MTRSPASPTAPPSDQEARFRAVLEEAGALGGLQRGAAGAVLAGEAGVLRDLRIEGAGAVLAGESGSRYDAGRSADEEAPPKSEGAAAADEAPTDQGTAVSDQRPAAAGGEPAAGPVTITELRARGLDLAGLGEVVEVGGLLVDAAAGLDVAEEPDVAVSDAAVALSRQANRWAGVHLGVLAQLSGRGLHLADGAMSAAAWLRARAHMDPAAAVGLVNAAERLRDLPRLREALEDGAASLAHVQAVTGKCVPARAEDFAAADAVLADLARAAEPRAVRVAVRRIIDCIDPDGSDDGEDLPSGPRDPRRGLSLSRTIDGLWELRATLDVLTGEKLAGFLDALSTRDDPELPPAARRTHAQRRHDAFEDLLARAQGLPDLPTVHGRAPHILGMIDWIVLAKLAGLVPDDIAVPDGPAARLRYSGPISTSLALYLLTQACFTLVRTEGPGRVVDVGRRMRVLPAYLRDVLQLIHRRCRGPDCDRWITWTQAHHEQRYEHGGRTDLNQTIPLCEGHHDLCEHGWEAQLDPDTLTVTWTTPTGRTITTTP